MSPENGLTLSGKYILSGGTVVYNIPIAGKKDLIFEVAAYVEWTGNVMNPMLSISASEQVKAIGCRRRTESTGYFRGYHPDTEYIDPTGYLF